MRPLSFLLLAVAVLSLGACRYVGGKRIDGNGQRATVSRSVGEFNGVEVRGGIDVIVASGTGYDIRVEADQNLIDYIEVHNEGGTIEVSSRDGYNLRSKGGIKVYATAPAFQRIAVAGSGDIRSRGKISNSRSMELRIKGSGDMQLEVDAPEVQSEIAGSGSVRLQGATRSFDADVRGSGNVHAFDLRAERTTVDIAGSGNAEVFASKELQVEIKGAGNVDYKGNARVSQKIMGAGNVAQVQ